MKKKHMRKKQKPLLEKIWQFISQNEIIVIGSHIDPDGDSLGAQLGLGHALQSLQKEVVFYCPSPVPQNYTFLPGSSLIASLELIPENFHLFISIDTPSLERLGITSTVFFRAKPTINIDHHISNQLFGDVNWIDTNACSSSELIYELLTYKKVTATQEIATCLYTGILTDTGCFNYANTTVRAHEIAAEMMAKGVRPIAVYEAVYENFELPKLRLLQLVLQTVKTLPEGTVGWAWIKGRMFDESGASPEDADGFINFVRAVKDVKVALLFEENRTDNTIRVSFRSKDPSLDVNKIAGKFGGGGHPTAAGTAITGTPEEAERMVIQAVLDEMTHEAA